MTEKQRFRRLAGIFGGLLAVGILYAAFVGVTGMGIPCVFRLITGFKCPGCGVSHMCMSLLRLDFKSAWRANPAIMALLPLGAAVAADMTVRYVRNGTSRPDRFSNAAMIFMLVVLLAFGVVRNLI